MADIALVKLEDFETYKISKNFKGALVTLASDMYGILDGEFLVNWDVIYDTSNLYSAFDNGFKIPSGISKIRLNAQIYKYDGAYEIYAIKIKTATTNDYIMIGEGNSVVNFNSPVIDVNEGDIITIEAVTVYNQQIYGGGYQNGLLPTYFALEVVE